MNEEGTMERNKLQKRITSLMKAGILSGIVLLVTGLMAPALADESISVSCYKDPKSE